MKNMKNHLPNILTLFRVSLIPLIVAILFLDSQISSWLSFVIFITAAITDFFDGWTARRFKSSSNLGKFLDPLADKLLVTSILVMLIYLNKIQGIFVFVTLIIILREILISGLREFLSSMNKKLPVSNLAKWKTTVQFLSISFLLIDDAIKEFPLSEIGLTLLSIAALLTLISAYDYIKNTFIHFLDNN